VIPACTFWLLLAACMISLIYVTETWSCGLHCLKEWDAWQDQSRAGSTKVYFVLYCSILT